MSRRTLWVFAAILVAIGVVTVLAARRSPAAGASVLSRSGSGLWLARAYLEEGGVDVRLLARPLGSVDADPAPSPERRARGGAEELLGGLDDTGRQASVRPPGEPVEGLLVLALPWGRPPTDAELDGLVGFVERGGVVLIAYGGQLNVAETLVLDLFGLDARRIGGGLPLAWSAWRREAEREVLLEPDAAWLSAGMPSDGAQGAESQPVAVRRMDRVPVAPAGALVLYRWPDGEPAIFASAYGGGRLVLVPANALANERLLAAGNADLLETLRGWLGDAWTFDEYHHGLVEATADRPSTVRRSFDLLLVHLGVLYLLGVWTVSRRFGPTWQDPPVRTGSAAGFLRGLGELHAELGHFAPAADLLVDRTAKLDPATALDDLRERARSVDDGGGLVALARAAAARRRERS